MKANKILVLIFITVGVSCESGDDILPAVATLKSKGGLTYTESLTQWKELKTLNGNSYIYETEFVSWAGFGSVTELKIENGVVTSRTYQQFTVNEVNGQREIVDAYIETTTNLGSHEMGANPLTIDDLYKSCAGKYLTVDKENNTLYFETEVDGLMSLCGYVPKGCMDDCFRGVKITSFKWLDGGD